MIYNLSTGKVEHIVDSPPPYDYNLSTGKVEHDSQFPTDAQAFMGSHRSDISLHNTGDVSYSLP